ncbi:hypothetical protein ACFQ3C_06835 [Seohaeicola saemankumensis]|uniref:Uncharacterized protein n=1 Tax=Seohaeicola saemankumensis TaxID=481181 RepID=A0ABW3TB17_9RHOB
MRHTYGKEFQTFLDEQIARVPVREAYSVREKWNAEIAALAKKHT